jgi:hypothetical protein
LADLCPETISSSICSVSYKTNGDRHTSSPADANDDLSVLAAQPQGYTELRSLRCVPDDKIVHDIDQLCQSILGICVIVRWLAV